MKKIEHLVVVGGGTAGWMAAAALIKRLGNQIPKITLLESDVIGTVGVGEATIPHLRFFNQQLGIDEHEFMRETNATYKLGIEFIDWGALGDAYIHPFGDFGREVKDVPFHHYFERYRSELVNQSLFDYSYPVELAKQNRFEYPSDDRNSIKSTYSYAFHIDATKYAAYLRKFSEGLGVVREEGMVEEVVLGKSGHIESLRLTSGKSIEGDFFIDCTGFRSLLLGEALGVGFEDWSHWLPCDKAVAVPSESAGETKPYTQAIARKAGWQWRIPLQHRTGNGHVYSSGFMDDDEASDILVRNLEGAPLANIRQLKFKAGRRRQTWEKNCVSIGLSSGFLEPLESTSIYLIQAVIMKLSECFPSCIEDPLLRSELNREMSLEYERVRDFLILHYHATSRNDSEFWNYVRTMSIPDGLKEKIEVFRKTGHVVHYERGLFLVPSWIAVYYGQGLRPEQQHGLVALTAAKEGVGGLKDLRKQLLYYASQCQSHQLALDSLSNKNPDCSALWPEASMSLYGVFS